MNNAWRIFGIIAAFIFVFLFGTVIGGSAMVLFSRHRFQEVSSRFQEVRLQREKEQAERQLERQKDNAQAAQLSQQIASLRQQLQQGQPGRNAGLMQRRGPMAPEQFGPHLMQAFANKLELTSDQQQQVHVLVFQTAEELRRLSRDTSHNSQIAIEHLEDRISALLTPAQRDRFNEMIERSRAAFQKFSEQQQQWRAQQRQQQQGWRQNWPGAGQGKAPGPPAAPAKAAPGAASTSANSAAAPATPSAGSTPSTPSAASPPAPAAQP